MLYLQQPSNHHIGNSGNNSGQNPHHLLTPPPAPSSSVPSPLAQPHGAGPGSTGSIRPGSMADRARMANIPMPEAALKCPRCESTNTKFCYFNNYSLTQPRHFCKTCRRYWTRGGALRNVPVGGGCRRNKRSKGSSSKSPPVSSDRQTGSTSSTTSVTSNTGSAVAGDIVGLSPQVPSLRFMAPFHQLSEFGTGEMGLNYGLGNYTAISGPMGGVMGDLNFHIGTAASGGGGGSILSAAVAGLEQWRMQQTHQFPFLSGLESSPSGLYPFEGGSNPPGYSGGSSMRPKVSTSGMITQLASVKMEDHRQQEVNLSRHMLGMNNNHNPSSSANQYWNSTNINATGNSNTTNTPPNWTDLSGFTSSSTTRNPL